MIQSSFSGFSSTIFNREILQVALSLPLVNKFVYVDVRFNRDFSNDDEMLPILHIILIRLRIQ